MEKYPNYVRSTARPLVFVTGNIETEPDIHSKVIRALESFQKDSDNKDTANNHLFKSVNVDFPYPEKKSPKEFLSVEGILKYNWPSKQFESIPSVVVYCVPFSVDWSVPEWSRRESACQDRYNRLKAVLGSRDVKVIILMVKIGSGSMEKDVMDERISVFKKHAQTDSKTFALIAPADLVMIDSNSALKRVYKSVREFSHAYYYANIRKFKVIEKTISERYKGVLECTLLARFNFKIAFLNEFQGAVNYSLRYYRQAYHALAASIETIDEEMYDQVKAVAEIAHFKLCNILFTTGATEEAFQQFKAHMSVFAKLYSAYPWRHFAWVADQYLVFVALLDQFGIREESFPSADRSYYYHNAARYIQKRELSFDKIKPEVLLRLSNNTSLSAFGIEQGESKDEEGLHNNNNNKFRGMEIMPPKFLGSALLFLDPVLDQVYSNPEESERFFSEYVQEKEVKVNHHLMTLEYLQIALDKMNPNYHRRRGILLALIAEEHIRDNKYELALSQLLNAVEYLRTEGWVYPAVSVLGLILKCTSFLGKPHDFVRIALSIYANGAYLYYSRHEIEELHLNLMSIFTATLNPNHASLGNDFMQQSPCVFDRSVYLTTSFIPLIKRSEYGSQSNMPQTALPEGCKVTINRENAMFSVVATYNKPAIELGQVLTVKVQVVSQFMDSMVFDEVKFHFLEEAVVKSVKRVSDATDSNNLTFRVNHKVDFVFDLEVTEDAFSRFIIPDGVFCLDHVEFIWYNKEDTTKSVTFDVNAYPDIVQRVKKIPTNKPLNAKDGYLFCPSEWPNFVTISKPSEILQILSPTSPVEVLEGIIQRVDVYCQVGKYDISEGKVYLSSDQATSSTEADDALFWTPDVEQLTGLGADQSSMEKLDQVAFYPFSLNSSLQPSQPLLLDGVLPANSIFVIPLFIRVRKLTKPSIAIKLNVDFLPKGIMKTSLVKELSVQVEVSQPFSVQYAISPLDYRNQYLGPNHLIFANCRNLLSCIVKCEKALHKGSVSLVSSQIKLKDETTAEQLSLSLQGLSLDKVSTKLKMDEEYVASIPFSWKGNGKADTTMINIGHFDLRWHITGVHPLQFTPLSTEQLIHDSATTDQLKDLCKCGLFPKSNPFSWLLFPLRSNTLGSELSQAVNNSTKLLSTVSSLFVIPQFQVEQLPISASVDLPSVVNLGDEFNIVIKLQNRRKSIEKTTLLVMLHEHYLISGSTSTFMELPIEAAEVMTLRAVALTAGKLAIPKLVVHWERRGSTHPVKILDTGDKDGDRYSIFVKPNESDLDHLNSKASI